MMSGCGSFQTHANTGIHAFQQQPGTPTMHRRAFLQGAAAIGLGAVTHAPAFAQSFPAGVIRTVVPASASTPPDIVARIVSNALTEGEGWRMIVEDKPGAVMTIGANEVLKQTADGHTLFSVRRRSRPCRRSCPTRHSISRSILHRW